MEIFLALIGAALGWIANHLYSRQGSKELRISHAELRTLIEKLPDTFVAAITSDRRKTLTVKELNSLLRQLTVDEATGQYKTCPKCGSTHLKEFHDSEVDADYDGVYLICSHDGVQCLDCDWRYTVTTSPSGEVIERKIVQADP